MRVINCECGFVVRGDTDEELVGNAREHLRAAHPEIAGQISDEQFLAMAEVAG
jgi:predicted small metal-binding protein